MTSRWSATPPTCVVPERERLECALLKAVTMRYVMGRPEAAGIQQREREVVGELVALLADRAPEALEPHYREMWAEAADDAARLRVVIDQVAALTDARRVWVRIVDLPDGPIARPGRARRGRAQVVVRPVKAASPVRCALRPS